MAKAPFSKLVAVEQIFLDLRNPRHERYDTEAEVIDYLCRNEDVLPLAKDIVENGLNPVEQFALLGDGETFIVAEGRNASLEADVCFVDFNRAALVTERRGQITGAHGFADTVGKKPSGLVLDFQNAVQLVGTDALLAGYDQVNGL